MQVVKRRLILAPSLLDSARRSFAPPVNAEVGRRLDAVITSFATGYNTALSGEFDPGSLPPGLRGFAYEGAAMSLTILDLMTLSHGKRLRHLGMGGGERYHHLIHVGAGWAFARMRLRPWRAIRFGRPVVRWLAWDGYGFHQAFFAPVKVFRDLRPSGPPSVQGICDQGAGRALWFYSGADPVLIDRIIRRFPAERRPQLWAGIGLAAAYTGAQRPDALNVLIERAGDLRGHLAQGAAFAAKAHMLAARSTDAVPVSVAGSVWTLTGASPDRVARWTDDALTGLMDTPHGYENWRAEIRRSWAGERTAVISNAHE